MKTLWIGAGAVAWIATGATAETFDFSDFDRIDVSAGIELIVTEGAAFSVEAEAIEGNLDRLKIRQSGDRLTIDRRSAMLFGLVRRQDQFRVEVVLPNLTRLDASSGSLVTLAADGETDVRFDVSSGAQVQIAQVGGDLEAHVSSGAMMAAAMAAEAEVEVHISSGASVTVDGPCASLEAEVSSGASLNAGSLLCSEVDLHASSSGSIQAHATGSAELDASSGGSIVVTGLPTDVSQNTSSGGSVSLR